MIDISIQKVKKAYEEGVDILDGITFDVNQGERVGLLGKNGAGKTTLLNIITGQIEADEGSVVVPGFKKLGLISQIPQYPHGYTADDVIRTATARLIAIKNEMEELEKAMADGNGDSLLMAYDSLAFEFERSGGYNIEFEINRVVNGLRIPQAQRGQLFDSLSGGEKTRINLARLILESTDILLLDEPTNHLDMRATIWLEEFLGKFKGSALIISHDRYFLDKTINRAVEIEAGKAEFYSGNYSYYVQEKQRRYEELLEKYQREQAEAKRLNDAADRLKQWGTGNEMLMKKSFAIRKRAERAVTIGRPSKDKTMRAKFGEQKFRGDEVMVIKGLTKSYDGRKLIDIDEIEVHGGERIAVIGDNGSGKTTLVKLIMGEEIQDSGTARRGPATKAAYLPQIVKFNHPRRSLIETLLYDLNVSPQVARNRLGAFMFSGEDVFKLVGDLSGGEKSRLRLCMLMNEDINLLILDEPTNHLDLSSREWIEDALDNYNETLIFISHDRYFINRFATRIWKLDNGNFTDFQGDYGQFLDYEEKQAKQTDASAVSHSGTQKPSSRPNKTVPAGSYQKPKARKPADTQKELRRLEREIEKHERKLDEIKLLTEEFSSDYEKLMELDLTQQGIHELLEGLYEQWEAVSE